MPVRGRSGDLDGVDEDSRRGPARPCRPRCRSCAAGSSRTLLSLLRHQRSSPRGSFGTSHRVRTGGCARPDAEKAPDRQTAPAPCARREARAATPSRLIVSGPSIRTRKAGCRPVQDRRMPIPRAFPRLLPRWPLRRVLSPKSTGCIPRARCRASAAGIGLMRVADLRSRRP